MIWQLTAKSGPRRGESWPIGDRPLTLGRSLGCEINIEDPTVSRRHCQIYLDGEGAVFRDLGSRNVSLVNGTVVTECRLLLGDELSVGGSVFILSRTANPQPVEDTPARNSPPSTVSLNRTLFDPHPDGQQGPVYPSTSREMVRMFQFGRNLSKATREEAFASICAQEMEELFPPEVSAALWCGGTNVLRCYPASFSPPDDLFGQVKLAMASGRPSMVRHRRKGRLFQDQVIACAAPLTVTGGCRGALLVYAPVRRYVLTDSDLARLDALAQVAAPFQLWCDVPNAHGGPAADARPPLWMIVPDPGANSEDDERRIAATIRDAQVSLDAAARATAGAYGAPDSPAHDKYTRKYHDPAMDAMAHAERTLIRAVLTQCDGDIARAAKIFGTTPAALRPLAEELGLIGSSEPQAESER